MGTLAAVAHLALKYGLPALSIIAADYGPALAAMAFFAFMPLGHLVLGVVLLVFGALFPRLPGDDTKQVIRARIFSHKIAVKGNTRTAILAGALVIIVGSLAEEMVTRATRGSAQAPPTISDAMHYVAAPPPSPTHPDAGGATIYQPHYTSEIAA